MNGETCIAIAISQGRVANFQNNAPLIEWVNAQSWENPVTCLGDGHDGVWNIGSATSSTEVFLHQCNVLSTHLYREDSHYCGPLGRGTQRMVRQLTAVGLALGGAAGERLSQQLGCTVSRNTILRLIARLPAIHRHTTNALV